MRNNQFEPIRPLLAHASPEVPEEVIEGLEDLFWDYVHSRIGEYHLLSVLQQNNLPPKTARKWVAILREYILRNSLCLKIYRGMFEKGAPRLLEIAVREEPHWYAVLSCQCLISQEECPAFERLEKRVIGQFLPEGFYVDDRQRAIREMLGMTQDRIESLHAQIEHLEHSQLALRGLYNS